MYQALVSHFELFGNFVTIRILLLQKKCLVLYSCIIKIPWGGGDGVGAGGGGETLKGSLGRGLMSKGFQTFILLKQKNILFTSLFKMRKLIS